MNDQFQLTRDFPLLNKLTRESPVYKFGMDDFSTAQENAEVIQSDYVNYVLVRNSDGAYSGFIALIHLSNVQAEFHPMIKLDYTALAVIPAFFEAVWANFDYHRLITFIPEDNKIAIRMAPKVGLVQYGFNPYSVKKNGKLIGCALFGISRPGEK